MKTVVNENIKFLIKDIYHKNLIKNPKNKDVAYLDLEITNNIAKISVYYFTEFDEDNNKLIDADTVSIIAVRDRNDDFIIEDRCGYIFIARDPIDMYLKTSFNHSVNDIYNKIIKIIGDKTLITKLMVKKVDLFKYITQILFIYGYSRDEISYILGIIVEEI